MSKWLKRIKFGPLFVFFLIAALIITILSIPSPASKHHCSGPREWNTNDIRSFAIRTTWDGQCIDTEPAKISLAPAPNGDVYMNVEAHFFDSPKGPYGQPSQPFPKLWDYEVVEAFFLNDNDQYLEVELNPHGKHLLLLLTGRRKMAKDELPIAFEAKISGDRWSGKAVIPRSYFPPGVTKFNAYAIHGEGEARQYEALYPLTDPQEGDQADFHRLELFQPIDMTSVMKDFNPLEVSSLWHAILQ